MRDDILRLELAKVLVIGDIMLDAYYEGDASRISPEAPVPVVKIERKRHILGGAGNVARNIIALGGKCSIISLVGKDFSAQVIKDLLKESDIEYYLLEEENRPTTVKSRIFARNQQMIRYDEETTETLRHDTKKHLKNILPGYLREYPVIILSDYGKGFLYEELIRDIYAAAEKINIRKPKIFIDPKPQNKSFYRGCFLLTPNHKESEALAGREMHGKEEICAAAKTILQDLNADNILVTLGADGMAYFSKEFSRAYHIKSSAKQVFDVTGAGDTVIATMAVCEAVGIEKETACNIATLAAGIVVEKVGSATAGQEELLQALPHTEFQTEIW